MADIEKLVRDFENFLDVTQEARIDAERDQDYVDHKQWTEEEAAELNKRHQAPVVINRVKNKVNLLTGIQRQRRTDPKALPRTPKHEQGADAVTDALRYVADNVDFSQTSSEVFDNELICYGAAIVEVEDNNGKPEIQVRGIPWDRYYFDPHSRKRDFSDKKFDGIVVWMDEDDVKTTFKVEQDVIDQLMSNTTDTVDGSTFDDKPKWIDRTRKRIRVCQHYYLEGGVWYVAYFTNHHFFIEPKESNYLDEFGKPQCPIESQSVYVDRDNNRYGEVRSYIWIQDEINHRRSKLLHLLSVRQTMGEKGAVDDVAQMKREMAKADGHVEVNPGKNFEQLDTNDMSTGQLLLYQESKAEIDSVGANAALSGNTEEAVSGRALQALQQGGIAELGALFDGHKSWERRIYRQIWNRIKQFWDAEKWIRVTDDEDNLKWVGLNQPVTKGQMLQELAQQGNQQAQAALQQFIDDPRLNEIAMTKNNVVEIDVDIVLSESPDYAVLRQEQFETLARLAQAYGPEAVPFEVMLDLSDMTHKDQVKQKLQGDVDPQQQAAQAELASMMAETEMESAQLDNQKKRAEIGKDVADIEQKQVETEKLLNEPIQSVNVHT
jgi:hypothetical protein